SIARRNRPERIMKAFYDFLTTEGLWLERWDTKEIAEIPELDETLRTTASAIETIGEKVLALSELHPDLGAVQRETMKNDTAWDFLERWCANTDTRAPLQVSNAVRIFTKTPPVLAYFPIWIMTGITQKTWSANVNSSPLLGNSEREKLAAKRAYLPTTFDKAAQHEALFRRLLQVGEDVTVVSSPELDDEGRPLSESPFMEKFTEDFPGWVIEKNKSGGIKILLNSDGFVFPKIDAGEKISRCSPAVSQKSNAVGASDIHKLLSCPFLWWQEKIAGLYSPNTEIVSQNDWGVMLHKFWERVWRRYRLDLGQNFIKIANDEWNVLTSGSEIEDYEQFSRLVKDFRLKRKLEGLQYRVERLSVVQSEILDGLHSAGYEHKRILLEEEACLQTTQDGIKFLGQCDRIEILNAPDGREVAFIADYKEGVGSSSEEPMTNIQNYFWNVDKREKFSYGLQLSVYSALFEREYNAELEGVYILGLNDGKISGSVAKIGVEAFKKYKSDKFKNSIDERVEEGEYAMTCAAEVLKAQTFAPEKDSDLCKFCKIQSICRKEEA
ncbi:MAG: PD-(D/E)XK nuclease family protein, partial [Synergistaceae bacterium]|nr:PD-(D/E)XK nuclease family protein [Synergistaceae bacterium]